MQTLTSKPDFRDKDFIPPLESGDRLTRAEFHRRYEAMPKNIKAELIKGVVYMASPVRVKHHGKPHSSIMSCFGIYFLSTPGITLLDNTTFIVDDKYEPQPDVILLIDENNGGKSWVNDDDYLEGAPEMIVEISSSSASYDLHDKLEIYERRGVQEYIVWRVLDDQIDWFYLEDGEYKRQTANKHGIVESKVFPGLNVNIDALLRNDLKKVVADIQTGMQTKKYLSFAKKLAK